MQLYLNMTVNGFGVLYCISRASDARKNRMPMYGNYTNLSTFWCSKINCGSATCLFVQASKRRSISHKIHTQTYSLLYSINMHCRLILLAIVSNLFFFLSNNFIRYFFCVCRLCLALVFLWRVQHLVICSLNRLLQNAVFNDLCVAYEGIGECLYAV